MPSVQTALRTEGEAVDRSPLRSTDTEAWRTKGEADDSPQANRSPRRPNALTAEDAERAERGLRGRALVEKSYSWDQIASQVYSLCV